MKKLLIPFTIIAFLVSSCDLASIDDDLNNNPNDPSQASAPQLIANAMLDLPDLTAPPLGIQGAYNAQHLSETIYVDGSLYQEGATSFYWLYEGPLVNLQTAINTSGVPNQAAVAKILKAYYYWHMTDRWGDLPYSEALQGSEDFTPAYDTQQSIYENLFALLKEASSEIQTTGGIGNDLIYNGDMEKWRKLSNTIRLLMALRLSEVDPQLAQEEFNTALDDGIMTSNDDSFIYQHLPNANNQNLWYDQIVQPPVREWWALSENLVGMMQPVDDPRLPVFADTTNAVETGGTDEYVGLPFGTSEEDITVDEYSLLGDAVHQQDSPVYLVTYAQTLFAKAEAAKRGWIAGGDAEAQANYEMAIENSILQWTGNTNGVTSFLAQPEVAYDPANAIEQISNQRYLHLFLHGFEAWAEYRRTGYPDHMVSPQGRDVPLRQSYTPDEQLNNTQNYNEAVDRQFGGENTLYGRLWWDVEQ